MVRIKDVLFLASWEDSLAVHQGCTGLAVLFPDVQLLHSPALCTVEVL